jgi:hypothetical protein
VLEVLPTSILALSESEPRLTNTLTISGSLSIGPQQAINNSAMAARNNATLITVFMVNLFLYFITVIIAPPGGRVNGFWATMLILGTRG